MLVCVEARTKCTENLLELIFEFSKTAEYKNQYIQINLFLYTNQKFKKF